MENKEVRDLMYSIKRALDVIPEYTEVGNNGESSYELASKLGTLLQILENKTTEIKQLDHGEDSETRSQED